MKFLLVAAKTGGHVFPASVIGKELIKNNHKVIFIGTGSEIEKNAYHDLNSELYELSMEGFRGANIIKKLQVLFQTFINVFKVIKIINKEKINAMIGFGGFITIPVGVACWIKKKPIFTHEQNAVIGSANKLLSKISKINFLGFPIKGFNKSIYSGNPIREAFVNNGENIIDDKNMVRIYITGGSQGSQYINKNLPRIFKDYSNNIKIIHQCGKNNFQEVSNVYYQEGIDAEISEFYQNPVEQILWSDFVISRGGALSLSEITSLRRGVVIIPLPTSIDNHQVENAKSVERMEMGIMHEEKDHINKLKEKIRGIIESKIYLKWKSLENNNHINSSKIIVKQLENYLDKNETL